MLIFIGPNSFKDSSGLHDERSRETPWTTKWHRFSSLNLKHHLLHHDDARRLASISHYRELKYVDSHNTNYIFSIIHRFDNLLRRVLQLTHFPQREECRSMIYVGGAATSIDYSLSRSLRHPSPSSREHIIRSTNNSFEMYIVPICCKHYCEYASFLLICYWILLLSVFKIRFDIFLVQLKQESLKLGHIPML